MTARPTTLKSVTKSFCMTFVVMAALLTWGSGAYASILVGTVVTPQTETVTEMNQLIADYNADFGASLPSATLLVDKLEGADAADFEQGNLALSDFDFYHQADAGGTSFNIFDEAVDFTPSTLGAADGFDSLDNPVFAFEQLSGPSFQYYVSKDGNLGWSLWFATDGLNPVYTDAGTGSSSLTGSGFTRGAITDGGLAYDPIKSAVSHISFYNAVPEPTSLTLVLLGGLMLMQRRRAGEMARRSQLVLHPRRG